MTCEQKIIIAGPCSAKSERQTIAAATMVVSVITAICGDKAKIVVRSPMVKQPTLPSAWTGPGEKGLVWLLKICNDLAVCPASEITDLKDAKIIARQCNRIGAIGFFGWLGSKTNTGGHIAEWVDIVKDIPNLKIGCKTPPQEDPREMEGRIRWVIEAGIPPKNIHLVDRGFSPQGRANPLDHRNLLNLSHSETLRDKFNLAGEILDPQHSGGTPKKALDILKWDPLKNRRFGWFLEACPTPTLTDEKQRFDLQNFITAIKIISEYLDI